LMRSFGLLVPDDELSIRDARQCIDGVRHLVPCAVKLRIGTGRCRYDDVPAAALPFPDRRLVRFVSVCWYVSERLKLKAVQCQRYIPPLSPMGSDVAKTLK
jgi:hypothetical protein